MDRNNAEVVSLTSVHAIVLLCPSSLNHFHTLHYYLNSISIRFQLPSLDPIGELDLNEVHWIAESIRKIPPERFV